MVGWWQTACNIAEDFHDDWRLGSIWIRHDMFFVVFVAVPDPGMSTSSYEVATWRHPWLYNYNESADVTIEISRWSLKLRNITLCYAMLIGFISFQHDFNTLNKFQFFEHGINSLHLVCFCGNGNLSTIRPSAERIIAVLCVEKFPFLRHQIWGN